MNRLQKKCFFMSTGIHLLLVVLLFVGPGFLASNNREEMIQIIDFVPSKLVDEAVSGGGNPNAPAVQAPPPQPEVKPPAPAPRPEPAPEPEPEPPRKAPEPARKQPEPDPESIEPPKNTPKISTVVKSNPKAKSDARKRAEAAARAREQSASAARQRLAGQISGAASRIGAATSSATTVEEYGPGGGGPAYASYASEVQRVYREAWVPPEETARDDAITRAEVTIASDGRVTSAKVIKESGDSQVDQSVRLTLQRVRFIAPFPEGSRDKQRTYIIKFDLKVKRGLA